MFSIHDGFFTLIFIVSNFILHITIPANLWHSNPWTEFIFFLLLGHLFREQLVVGLRRHIALPRQEIRVSSVLNREISIEIGFHNSLVVGARIQLQHTQSMHPALKLCVKLFVGSSHLRVLETGPVLPHCYLLVYLLRGVDLRGPLPRGVESLWV